MIIENRMIMIGATGRNSGKTSLACEIIKNYKDSLNVVGLKITTIESRDMLCPRGGEGCGVCTSVTGNYDIIQEMGSGTDKDTVRLLDAGCSSVYWIRTHKEYILNAYEEFLEIAKDADLIICESNSLRHYVKPHLFIMIKNTSDAFIKPTAASVIEYADYIISKYDVLESKSFTNELLVNLDRRNI